MSDDVQAGLIKSLFAIIGTIVSGITLHNFRKVQDMPEKYLSKNEFQEMKKEIREDVKCIHDKLDKIFEDIYKPKIT